jgi:hypothetical protein
MQEYRGYSIENESGLCVARPLDGDNFVIVARELKPVTRTILDLWIAADYTDLVRAGKIDQIPVSHRVREWLDNPTDILDLDDDLVTGDC